MIKLFGFICCKHGLGAETFVRFGKCFVQTIELNAEAMDVCPFLKKFCLGNPLGKRSFYRWKSEFDECEAQVVPPRSCSF